MIDVSSGYARLRDVTLHYVSAGTGDPVVLLHGWPQTWYMWRKIIPVLAENYRVIAPDLRGLGQSSRPAEGYDKKTIAADIVELVHDHLGLGPIHLVGHDWGGPVAFSYAIHNAERVRKLALLDVPVPGDGTDVFWAGRWHHPFHWITDVPEALTAGRERIYLEYFFRTFGASPDAIDAKAMDIYVEAYAQPGAMRAGFNFYRATPTDVRDNEDALTTHGKLRMPVLALAGSEGRGRGSSVVMDSASRVAENVTGGEVPDTGHWLVEEKPDVVAGELMTFFQN